MSKSKSLFKNVCKVAFQAVSRVSIFIIFFLFWNLEETLARLGYNQTYAVGIKSHDRQGVDYFDKKSWEREKNKKGKLTCYDTFRWTYN